MGDLKQWSSRHRRHRRRYCRSHRRSGSNVERKMKAIVNHVRYQCRCQNKSDEEAKKKQQKGIDRKVILVAISGFEIPV
ncbi:hypothetical protein [Absidia glauca]|uniref:Uncharacterized protein n=1 Tax=Absidia glauca TaxID=4829 RepID=A0A168PNB4_ABSGL|nr:hypothetical protein [Absidia glauca]